MANFTASLMSDGERIIVERRQHWLVLVDRSKLAILGLVVALLIFIFRGNLGTDGRQPAAVANACRQRP